MVAAMVEMGPTGCTCDSMAFLEPSLRSQVASDGGIFRDITKSRKPVPRFSGADRIEYAKDTLRGLESGTLFLMLKVCEGGSVFTVGKPVGDNVRCGMGATFQA